MNTVTKYFEKIKLLGTSYCTTILHSKIFGNSLKGIHTCEVFCFDSNADFLKIYINLYMDTSKITLQLMQLQLCLLF